MPVKPYVRRERHEVTLMVGALLVVCSLGVPGAASAGELPRVAVVYSSFPDGAFAYRDEYAADLTRLGWPAEQFENTRLAELVEHLDEFDLLIFTTAWNLEHTQNLLRHADKLREFVRYGGLVVLTDANHETHVDWLPSVEPRLSVEVGTERCPTGPERAQWVDVRHPLLAGITDLPVPETHPSRASGLWQVLARCADGGPTLVCREIGDGIIVTTALSRESGFPDVTFLQNLWLWARDWGRINAAREREEVAYRALTEPKELEAKRIDPPVIDGIIEEEAWNNAAQTAQFVLPDKSLVAQQETHALIGFDDYWAYIAFRCTGSNPTESDEESVEAFIDPTGQRANPRRFAVTSAGTAEPSAEAGWWQSAVRVTPDGWTAEMRIPLVVLGDVKAFAKEWAVNFSRDDPGSNEVSVWAPGESPNQAWAKLTKVAVDPNLCPIRLNRIELTGSRLSASFTKPSYGDFHGRYVVECTSPSGVTKETAREIAIREFDSLAVETEHRMDVPGAWLLRARAEVDGGPVWVSEAIRREAPGGGG